MDGSRIARLVGEAAKFSGDLDEEGLLTARFDPINGNLTICDSSGGSNPIRITLAWSQYARLAALIAVALERVQ